MFSKEPKNTFKTETLTSMPLHFHKCLIPQVKILPFILWIYPVVWPILVFRYSCKELLRTHLACWAFALRDLTLAMVIYNKKIDVFKPWTLQTFIRLPFSEHSFGEINALLTALTKLDLWCPCSLHISQTEIWDLKIQVTRSETLMSEETLYSKNSPSLFLFSCYIAIILALV